ncbi:hypothetical protein ACFXTO_042315 [Malus domestica]
MWGAGQENAANVTIMVLKSLPDLQEKESRNTRFGGGGRFGSGGGGGFRNDRYSNNRSCGESQEQHSTKAPLLIALRYYYVDRIRVHHFKPSGRRKWFENPRNVLIVGVVGSGSLCILGTWRRFRTRSEHIL